MTQEQFDEHIRAARLWLRNRPDLSKVLGLVKEIKEMPETTRSEGRIVREYLVLEIKSAFSRAHDIIGSVMVTPPLGEDYWLFRVKLTETQAIVGFPKFHTIGIGFAQEKDWNTNLPYTCYPEHIYDHIKHNKGDEQISDGECIEAIKLIQLAAVFWPREGER